MIPGFLPSSTGGGAYDGQWGQIALTLGLRARLNYPSGKQFTGDAVDASHSVPILNTVRIRF